MSVLFNQLFLLYAFMLFGYVFGKSGVIAHEHSKVLSTIAVYIFLPSNIFKAFSKNFTLEYLKNYYPSLIVSAGLVIVILTAVHFTVKLFSKKNTTARCMNILSLSPTEVIWVHPLPKAFSVLRDCST